MFSPDTIRTLAALGIPLDTATEAEAPGPEERRLDDRPTTQQRCPRGRRHRGRR